MEIVISDTNIFIDLWNIGLLKRFCELPLSIHTTDFIIGELKTQGVKDAIAQLHQEGKITIKTFKSNHLYFHTPSEPPLFKGDTRDVKNKK